MLSFAPIAIPRMTYGNTVVKKPVKWYILSSSTRPVETKGRSRFRLATALDFKAIRGKLMISWIIASWMTLKDDDPCAGLIGFSFIVPARYDHLYKFLVACLSIIYFTYLSDLQGPGLVVFVPFPYIPLCEDSAISSTPILMAPPAATEPRATMDTQIANIVDKLSVNGVAARRSKAPKMSGGIAAHSSSDMFKSPVGFDAWISPQGFRLT